MQNDLLSLFLPEGLLDRFDVSHMCEFCKLDTRENGFVIHLVEKNIIPEGYISSDYETKDFTDSKLIQDFPARGKLIF